MRLIKADEILVRVAQCFEKGCTLLLYKDARYDRAMLDEMYGEMNWQNDFKVVDGKIYGGISVWNKELGQWITKWDVGTESNTEAEKGQASDAFKRAAFKWGIGVELYTAPFIFATIPTRKNEKGKYEPANRFAKFKVSNIAFDEERRISALEIVDSDGNVVYKTRGAVVNKVESGKDNSELLKKYKETLDSLGMVGDASILESQKKEMFGGTIPPLMLALKKAGLTKELEHLGEVFAKKFVKDI